MQREDERQLETDLIRAACRLEASMLRKCGTRADHELSHDLLAIKDQVLHHMSRTTQSYAAQHSTLASLTPALFACTNG